MKTQFLRTLFLPFVLLLLAQCGEKENTDQSSTMVYETIDGKVVTPTEKQKNSGRKPLTLVITNLRSSENPIVVGLYENDDHFLYPEGRLKGYTFIPNSNTLTAQIIDQEYGEYAISIFQDDNGSGKMDKNALGIPKEAWGLSNNFRPKIKAPSYKDCKFDYNEQSNTLNMEMVW